MTINDIFTMYSLDFLNVQFGIPMRTLQSWKRGERKPPDYVVTLISYAVCCDYVEQNLVKGG